MPMLIMYSHRPSDYTQDVYVGDVWVATAKNNHAADLVADACVNWGSSVDDDKPGGIENEPDEPPVHPQPGG